MLCKAQAGPRQRRLPTRCPGLNGRTDMAGSYPSETVDCRVRRGVNKRPCESRIVPTKHQRSFCPEAPGSGWELSAPPRRPISFLDFLALTRHRIRHHSRPSTLRSNSRTPGCVPPSLVPEPGVRVGSSECARRSRSTRPAAQSGTGIRASPPPNQARWPPCVVPRLRCAGSTLLRIQSWTAHRERSC